MKRVETKIQKAIGRTVEYKIRTSSRGAFTLVVMPTAANPSLPVSAYFTLTNDWPPTGGTAGAYNTRIGNSLKKCTTYFALEFRIYLNVGTAVANNLLSVTYRVIIFTTAEIISLTDPITNFFQFNTNTAGVPPMINPTNKGKVTVLYDKVHKTPLHPNPSSAYAVNWPRGHFYIRYSRKFKEVLFDSLGDTTPKRPYRNTYCAAFAVGPPTEGLQVGTVNNVIRYYWLD